MNVALQRDIGSYITTAACEAASVTAGAAGDGAEIDGQYVDRQGHLSAKLVIAYKATLAEDETLTLAANMQDASDASGTGVADYGDALAAAVQATGGTGGSTEYGTAELDVDLSSAKQYVRAQVTPTLSATGTDVVILGITLVLGPNNFPVE